MVASWPVSLLVGTVLGFLAGLGTGGGSLLILWLTLVLDMDPNTARSINLMFFLPAALISILFRKQQGHVDFRTLWPGILSGCLSAAIFAFWCRNLELTLLKKLFGGLLLITGARELFYKPKNKTGGS